MVKINNKDLLSIIEAIRHALKYDSILIEVEELSQVFSCDMKKLRKLKAECKKRTEKNLKLMERLIDNQRKSYRH